MAISWVSLTAKMHTSSTVSYDVKIRTNNFGDGYQARIPLGINNKPRKFNVVYQDITYADHQALVTYWNTYGGTGQAMTVPVYPEKEDGSVTALFIFDPASPPSYSADEGGALYNWTIPLQEVYGE